MADELIKIKRTWLTASCPANDAAELNKKPRTWERLWQKGLVKTKDWLNCYAETRPEVDCKQVPISFLT